MKTALVLAIGKSNLELTIHDADNQLALHIKDSGGAGSPSTSYIETNKAMNLRGFNQLFNGWSNNFAIYFNIVAEPSTAS